MVELERASLYRQGARGGARLSGFIDDPHRDAESGQPEREYETGRPGPDDQDRAWVIHPDAVADVVKYICRWMETWRVRDGFSGGQFRLW
jgi:hypothetical protein